MKERIQFDEHARGGLLPKHEENELQSILHEINVTAILSCMATESPISNYRDGRIVGGFN
jgi:hypothetical protein